MMKINKLQRDALDMALQAVGNEFGVRIYTVRDTFLQPVDTIMEYGVNWSGQGTCTVAQTLSYIETLTKAVGICKTLNSLELVTDYTNDPQPESLDEFRKKAEDLKNIILAGVDAEFVVLALNKIQ